MSGFRYTYFRVSPVAEGAMLDLVARARESVPGSVRGLARKIAADTMVREHDFTWARAAGLVVGEPARPALPGSGPIALRALLHSSLQLQDRYGSGAHHGGRWRGGAPDPWWPDLMVELALGPPEGGFRPAAIGACAWELACLAARAAGLPDPDGQEEVPRDEVVTMADRGLRASLSDVGVLEMSPGDYGEIESRYFPGIETRASAIVYEEFLHEVIEDVGGDAVAAERFSGRAGVKALSEVVRSRMESDPGLHGDLVAALPDPIPNLMMTDEKAVVGDARGAGVRGGDGGA